jgi:translation initiation factor 1
MADNIVYSTDKNWNPDKKKKTEETAYSGTQTAYIRLERKGRKGKAVTVVANLKGSLKELQKELQKHCGTGGSLKGGQMELQGDQRKKTAEFLQKKGIKVKMSGG